MIVKNFVFSLSSVRVLLWMASVGFAWPAQWGVGAEVRFVEATSAHGLASDASRGTAIADFDHDGDLDIMIAQVSSPALFYVNQGDGTFIDQATTMGLAISNLGETGKPIIWDFDNDGQEDVYLSTSENKHMVNQGDNTFVDRALLAGLNQTGNTSSAIPIDFDHDGRLDLYLARGAWDGSSPGLLLRNQDGVHFTDYTQLAGLNNDVYGGGVLVADFDNDGDGDLYVIHNGVKYMCRNNGNGTFTRLDGIGVEISGVGNSGVAEDFDGDGDIDIFVLNDSQTNFGDNVPSKYLRNNYVPTGHLTFSDATAVSGITNLPNNGTDASAGDVDNDGDLDLYVAVHEDSGTWQDHLYLNNGHGVFTDVTAGAGLVDGTWRNDGGCSLADLDGDGDLDLLLSKPVLVFQENRTIDAGHWLDVQLQGTKSNREGVGARVWVEPFRSSVLRRQMRDFQLVKPGGRQDGSWMHFGLGAWADMVVVSVRWPNSVNNVERFYITNVDRRVVLVEGEGQPNAVEDWCVYR